MVSPIAWPPVECRKDAKVPVIGIAGSSIGRLYEEKFIVRVRRKENRDRGLKEGKKQ